MTSTSSNSGPRKGPSKDNPNSDMCEFLMELSAYERNVSRNTFKSNAYRSAASALAAYPTRVANGKEASTIKGIGKKIAEKIDEFLTTGKLKKLEKIRVDDTSIALGQLTRVSGIGPAKARQLYDAGITDLAKLQKQTDLLTHHQLVGLKFVEEFERRIPRSEVVAIQKSVKRSLAALPQLWLITVCGSFRRGSENAGDVDILLTYEEDAVKHIVHNTTDVKKQIKKRKNISDSSSDKESTSNKKNKLSPLSPNAVKKEEQSVCSTSSDVKAENISSDVKAENDRRSKSKPVKAAHKELLQTVVDQLQLDGIVTDTLSLGDTKFMGVCKVESGACHRRLDIRLMEPQHYYCGVLYFTGSDLFNKEMRTVALAAGFTINEYSIRPVGSTGVPGEPLPVTSERDVFDYIGMTYKEPKDRSM